MARFSAGDSAITRALRILDVFGVDAPFLTLSEIARRAGYPTSTTQRIVKELVRNRLMEPVEARRYRLGNRLWELGARTPGALGLREIARPFLVELHPRIGQHVQLAVPYDTDALVVERLSAVDAVVNATVIGGRMPLQYTALGLVLLAYDTDDVLDKVIAAGLRPPTDVALRTVEELQNALELTRKNGYAVADGYIFPASRGIAVPVTGSQGVVVAALGAVVPNDATPTRPIAELLRRTAKAISSTLLRVYLPPTHPNALPGGTHRYLVNSSTQSMQFFERRKRVR